MNCNATLKESEKDNLSRFKNFGNASVKTVVAKLFDQKYVENRTFFYRYYTVSYTKLTCNTQRAYTYNNNFSHHRTVTQFVFHIIFFFALSNEYILRHGNSTSILT